MTELLAFACPLAISLLLTATLLHWAPRLGLVDLPNARKVHTRPVPRGGGLAIYASVMLTAYLLPICNLQSAICNLQFPGPDLTLLLALGGGIVLLGLIDDLRPLPWQLRLGMQTAAAMIVVWTWPDERGWLLRAAAVFWIVALINAFNMLDNMDGLSAGVAWIAAGAFALDVGLHRGAPEALPFLTLMGALSGFLWFNRPPARIFMGDAGSTFLGFFLGVRSLRPEIVDTAAPATWVVPLFILAVPWYDLTTVVTLRLWQGHSPFHADKQHLSHRLVARLSSPAAVRVIYLFGLGSGMAGLLAVPGREYDGLLVGVGLASWWLAVATVEYFRHFRAPK